MEDRSSRRMRTLVTRLAHLRRCSTRMKVGSCIGLEGSGCPDIVPTE
jgi:hypothetical protein